MTNATPHAPAGPDAIHGCLDVCRQCRALVEAIGAEGYAWGPAGSSTIGAHMRHCLDHFSAFLAGVPSGLVDYDARERSAALERDAAEFLAAISAIEHGMESMRALDPAMPLRIVQLHAPGAEPRAVPSCLERELVFLASHTIHHLALMKLLAQAGGFAVPAHVGVAYSTLAHQQGAHHH
jgi:hypothetical protein